MIKIPLNDVPENAFSAHVVKSYSSPLTITLSGATLRDKILSEAQIKFISYSFRAVFKQVGRDSEKIVNPSTFDRNDKKKKKIKTPLLPKIRLGEFDLSVFEQYGEEPEEVYSPFILPKKITRFQQLGKNIQLTYKGDVDLIVWFFRLAKVEVYGSID